MNIEEFAKNIIKIIESRKDRGNIGTITRIYSYCKKQIKQNANVSNKDTKMGIKE